MLIEVVAALCLCTMCEPCGCGSKGNKMNYEESTPQYLYKVLSMRDWEESEGAEALQLSSDDEAFIHFSREDQVNRIVTKYWNNIPKFVVLKIEVSKLPGKMVLEANQPGGAKYYHLYNGSIPLDAVADIKFYATS